ncbi:MAG: YhcH/YjgK/YiaL family protein [Bacteroidia bacterium]|nr:YhcH/YjgK/YiaL family protein [Bacteroidia bacterium]
MILDKIENSPLYAWLGYRYSRAFTWLKCTDLEALPAGRTDILGDEIYAVNLAYDTKPAAEGSPEAHRRYADVQYMYRGQEMVGFAAHKDQKVKQEYDSKADYALYEGEFPTFLLEEGMFAIFLPDDLHQPGIMVDAPQGVKKVVLKVKLD